MPIACLSHRTNTCADTITYKTKWSESVRFMEDKPKVTTMAATNEEPQEIAMMISHGKKLAKLSKPADQRKALMRALTTELLRHGRIKTNVVRAKVSACAVRLPLFLRAGGWAFGPLTQQRTDNLLLPIII